MACELEDTVLVGRRATTGFGELNVFVGRRAVGGGVDAAGGLLLLRRATAGVLGADDDLDFSSDSASR